MNAFSTVAEFYELLSDSDERLRRETSLLEECLRQAPGHCVVDVACGTGFHAHFFAEHGARVSAQDLSPDMIAHARETRPHPNIAYAVSDMRDPIGGPWDLAVCLGNSLSLLPSLDDVRKTMNNLFALLSPGGLFLVQVLNYQLPTNQKPRHQIKKRKTDEGEVVAIKDLVPDAGRTLLALTFFSIQDGDYFAVSDAAMLQNLTMKQIRDAASKAGFRIEGVYGNFDRTEYDVEKSTDLILLCRRLP